jgi:hypothetical protein
MKKYSDDAELKTEIDCLLMELCVKPQLLCIRKSKKKKEIEVYSPKIQLTSIHHFLSLAHSYHNSSFQVLPSVSIHFE